MADAKKPSKPLSPLQKKIHDVIFEADTPDGKRFDVILLILIVISLVLVMMETVESLNSRYGDLFKTLEWVLTVLFTIEYVLRIYSVKKSWNYIFSFYGLVDLLSILPSYLSLFFTTGSAFLIIRAIRLLRVFRVFKLGRFLSGANLIIASLKQSFPKIVVFISSVLTLSLLMASAMYLVEGPENGFTSIPKSMYWAIVTMTTVGYGDISPHTGMGQFLASVLMILGYGIIAVPTGIVTSDFIKTAKSQDMLTTQACPSCMKEGHDKDATFCKYCGENL